LRSQAFNMGDVREEFNILFAVMFVILGLASVKAQEQTVGLFQNDPNAFNGSTLFAPIASTTTCLIDMNGRLVHTWASEYRPGQSAYLLENGNLLRTSHLSNVGYGASGGGVQEIAWDGTVVWEFEYRGSDYLPHHDIEPLPSGNVLMLVRELKTYAEAIAAGRNPSLLSGSELWPEYIVEIEPNGLTGGDVVWEWHLWDHLIQDYDPNKANYGVVADHPELMNINFAVDGRADWIHGNAVAYNPHLDQVVISARNVHELWLIDHSTTTAEAAGHTGGDSGMGGDILYRWGNPESYGAGSASDQKLFCQHDTHWVEVGLPGEGNILIFNNGDNRPGGNYSSVDEIVPPVDANGHYTLTTSSAYGPDELVRTYAAEPPTDFYAPIISGAQRLANGNTIICSGPQGTFFEVTSEGQTVWKYVNPVNYQGPITQGDPPLYNLVFRCYRYAPDYPGLAGKDLTPGDPIELCYARFYNGNIDGDCDIDLLDFAMFAQQWLQTNCGLCNGADFTGDQNVDFDDLQELTANWLAGF
jgi:hypothetical protein